MKLLIKTEKNKQELKPTSATISNSFQYDKHNHMVLKDE